MAIQWSEGFLPATRGLLGCAVAMARLDFGLMVFFFFFLVRVVSVVEVVAVVGDSSTMVSNAKGWNSCGSWWVFPSSVVFWERRWG